MSSQDSPRSSFAVLSTYTPHEAAQLLERLRRGGIEFVTRQLGPRYESAGPTIRIEVSIDPARASDAAKIHSELFGDGLPNYDSSFFQQRRNV